MQAAPTRTGRPHVVLISLDTLRYDCVGACPDKAHLNAWGLGSKLRTPNLDEFFTEGLCFTQALTTAPYTTSAHASVMTGLYPNKHGVRGFYKWAMADGVGTLAQELKGQGYATVAVQEGGTQTALRTGSDILRGFDAFFADEQDACAHCAEQSRPCLLFIHTFDVHAPYCSSGVPQVDCHRGAWDAARRQIFRRLGVAGAPPERDRDKMDFYFWVCANARARLGDRRAAALLLDWYVRGVNWFDAVRWPRIVAALRGAGLYDEALVVVFADHGEALLPDFIGPPMSHSPSLLEDVIRVPLAVRGPGLEGARVDRQVSLVDVAPTVLDYLRATPSAVGLGGRTDGQSLLASPATPAVHVAEAWRTYPRKRRHGDDMWRAQQSDPCEPFQVCARSAGRKLIWQPGPPRLWRFMRPGRRLIARLRSAWRGLRQTLSRFRPLATSLLPGGAWELQQRVRRKAAGLLWREGGAAAPSSDAPAPDRFRWREAPLFMVDLEEDPLEERPRRVDARELPAEYQALLDRVKHYWEEGRCGPAIDLTADDEEKVLRHLRGLGYVD